MNKKRIVILFFIIASIACGTILGGFFALINDLPEIRLLETFRPLATTRIYSTNKVLLAELFAEKRDAVPLHIIPEYLKESLLAVEDRKFYTHKGIDLKGILRAIVKDIIAGKFVQGASTITQQLAKTLFLTNEKTFTRKIKEVILSFQLERRYTKDEILEMYLNQIYLGSGAYGVESAARIFFNKSVQNLSLAECALISAMPRSPSRYSPLINPDLALKRRNLVLDQMKKVNIITKSECIEAKKEPVNLGKQNKYSIKAPYFIEYLKPFLEEIVGPSRLYKGGLDVFTTLNFRLQETAEHALSKGIEALKIRMNQKKLSNPNPQGALLAIDVESGRIVAMTGGNDFNETQFNRATSALRQPGSAFKPILYGYAIESGFSQNSIILDAPILYKTDNRKQEWQPQNFSKKYKGEITLRMALTISQNVPAVRLIEILNPSSVVRFGHKLGIQTPLLPNLSLALGTSETTLLDLTAAYTVFPNHGQSIKPYSIVKIVDQNNGRIVWQVKPVKSVAMSRMGAAIMVDMLEAVIQEGTGMKAKVLNFPVAGKTGTTNDYKDALFIGFSPKIAAGVWVGQDNALTLGEHETGSKAALPIWVDFMSKTINNTPQYFDIPDGMVRVLIDPLTGQPVDPGKQGGVSALFIEKNAPKSGNN